MNLLGIIAALVLIAIFWRQLLGLAIVVVVAGLLIVGAVAAWESSEDFRHHGNWKLTFDGMKGEKALTVKESFKTRAACEKRRDEVLETTRRANPRDGWNVWGECQ